MHFPLDTMQISEKVHISWVAEGKERIERDLLLLQYTVVGQIEQYNRGQFWCLNMNFKACCALYEDGQWYRGLVVGIQSVDSIEVCTYMYYRNRQTTVFFSEMHKTVAAVEKRI